MDTLATLVIGAIALEAVVQLLRNVWDSEYRSNMMDKMSLTGVVVIVIPLVTLLTVADDVNIADGLGLDLDQAWLGSVVTALAAARVANWVHDFYKKSTG